MSDDDRDDTGEKCQVAWCQFAWDYVNPDEIAERILGASRDAAEMLVGNQNASARPEPEVWSPVEYGGHLRDVLFNIRDRLVVALCEPDPVTKGLYGPERVDVGLYQGDSADVVAEELLVAAALFARTWTRIPPELRSRTMVYRYPREDSRNLTWVAAQALHEVEHHRQDIRNGLAALAD